jgi:hypothetical protein
MWWRGSREPGAGGLPSHGKQGLATRARKCLPPPPFNWRNGASRAATLLESLRSGGVAAAPTAPGATSIEAVATAISTAIAAIFPVTGSGGAILAAAAVATAAAAVTTPTAAIAATTTAITATAAAVTTAAASLSATTATTTTTAAGFGLVDAKGPAHQLGSLQPFDGPRFHLVICHLHKSETALTAGVPLQREGTIHHITKTGEEFKNVLLLCAEGKIADKDAHERGWGNRYGCRGTLRVSDPHRLDGLWNLAR